MSGFPLLHSEIVWNEDFRSNAVFLKLRGGGFFLIIVMNTVGVDLSQNGVLIYQAAA